MDAISYIGKGASGESKWKDGNWFANFQLLVCCSSSCITQPMGPMNLFLLLKSCCVKAFKDFLIP